jgi:anaerobic selenocysteine-containing dehydrogenase
MWNSWAELSPPDAARLGVSDGDRLRVESPTGSVEVMAVVDPTVRPGLVGMPLGQGYSDYGRYARGRGANPLDLVGRLTVDETSAPAWAATRVRIQRLGSGELARFGRSYTERGEGERLPVGWAPQDAGAEEVP